jgi:hypothetical protein
VGYSEREVDDDDWDEKAFLKEYDSGSLKVPTNLPVYGMDERGKSVEDAELFIAMFEAKLEAALMPKSRWAAQLPAQMKTLPLIAMARKWVKMPWEKAKAEFLGSQLSVRVQQRRRDELHRLQIKK